MLKGAEAATGHEDQIKDGERREREDWKEKAGGGEEGGSGKGNRSFKTEGS